ncbi:hypothetical protein [Rosettibacter firmus]|uniref:hypothetical protein n=1 Tax=Rosettibacter firmus TaxID=3111522 RepID=UPI00336BF62F
MEIKKENKSQKVNLTEADKEEYSTKVNCPNCNSNNTIIIDHKKITSKNQEWICLTCGFIFNQKNAI